MKIFLPQRRKPAFTKVTAGRGAKIFLASLCLCGLIFSCSKKEIKIPADIIPKEKMVELLVAFHLAQAKIDLKSPVDNTAALKNAYYQYIFQKHNTNYTSLKTSFDYYSSHPDIFSKIYDEVITELSKKQAQDSKSGEAMRP